MGRGAIWLRTMQYKRSTWHTADCPWKQVYALPAQLLCAFRYFLDAPRNSLQANSKPIPSGSKDCVTALYSSAINIQWTNTAPFHLQATAAPHAPQLGRCTERQMTFCSTYVWSQRSRNRLYLQPVTSNVVHGTDSILFQQYVPVAAGQSVWNADSVHLQAEVTSMAGRTERHTEAMDECLG